MTWWKSLRMVPRSSSVILSNCVWQGERDWQSRGFVEWETLARLHDEVGDPMRARECFVKALANMEGPVVIRVNSPGGDVFGAKAMAQAVREYSGKVTGDTIKGQTEFERNGETDCNLYQ